MKQHELELPSQRLYRAFEMHATRSFDQDPLARHSPADTTRAAASGSSHATARPVSMPAVVAPSAIFAPSDPTASQASHSQLDRLGPDGLMQSRQASSPNSSMSPRMAKARPKRPADHQACSEAADHGRRIGVVAIVQHGAPA